MSTRSLNYFLFFLVSLFAFSHTEIKSVEDYTQYCVNELSQFPGKYSKERLKKVCGEMSFYPNCYSSENKKPIMHYDKFGTHSSGQRILVFSMFHGDEYPAGSVSRYWLERLQRINPRSTWRIVPIVNPDGVKRKTRYNGRNVDLNRNLPTKNWNKLALNHWEKKEKENERRYPGPSAASEQETKCVINHVDIFKPDFIISLHTPYGVLDFDGPKNMVRPVIGLKGKNLGHFPGSLGRYMWAERNVPVLTVELKGNSFNLSKKELDRLQDKVGSLAIKSKKKLKL